MWNLETENTLLYLLSKYFLLFLQGLAFLILVGSALANYDFAHYYEYVYPDQTKTVAMAQLPPMYTYYTQSVAASEPSVGAVPAMYTKEIPIIAVYNKEAPVPEVTRPTYEKQSATPEAIKEVESSLPLSKESPAPQEHKEASAQLKESPKKIALDYYVSTIGTTVSFSTHLRHSVDTYVNNGCSMKLF